MALLSTPPIYENFVTKKGYLTPRWLIWFEEVERKVGIPLGTTFIEDNELKTEGSEIDINPTGSLTIQGDTWSTPSVAGTILTTNGSSYSWDSISFSEAVPTGIVRGWAGTTAPDGWVLLDDGTIGNSSSVATTRANSDTEDLFTVLWNNCADAQCPVSGGRGASAAIDFAANKTITLPLMMGRSAKVKDGSSALGETEGAETASMTEAQMPEHEHTITTAVRATGIGAPDTDWIVAYPDDIGGTATYNISASGLNPATDLQGSGDAQNLIQPTTYLNYMISL